MHAGFSRTPLRHLLSLGPVTIVIALVLACTLPASAVQFGPPTDLATGIGFTTALTLGPEDPDPASNRDGCIYAVNGGAGSVTRVCFDANKSVTSSTTPIDLNGANPVNNTLGIAIDPDSDPDGEIHLYLAYSDDNSAPFNGKIARAVSSDGGVSYSVDENFITGLARSSFDHQTNGLDFGPDGCLYIAQGNSSNAGYDSQHAESRLGSAILRACFKSASGGVAPGFDRNCGDGNSQQACDVAVFASGLRNPYDLVWHSNGRLYNADNDANPGFRDNCGAEANNFGCSCQAPVVNPIGDELNLIEAGAYYGSPNPYRANPAGLQCNGGTDGGDACSSDGDCAGGGTCEDLSALCSGPLCGEAVQCHYFGYGETPQAGEDPNGLYREPIAQIGALLDGMTEYRTRFDGRFGASFCSDWNGDLLITGGPGNVRRFTLSVGGTAASDAGTTGLNGISGLDVVVGPDGAVYTADLYGGRVRYIDPLQQTNPALSDYFGFCAGNQACAGGQCESDGDGDGLGDTEDPCPADPRNLCVGPVAVDGISGNPIRVNANTGVDACAGNKTDCNGDSWFGDFGFNEAASAFTCDLAGGCPIDTSTLMGCDDAATEDLFRCQHRDDAPLPDLAYDFGVPDGDYVVNLLFMNADAASTSVGDTRFNIAIEGAVVQAGYDPVAAAGGSGIPSVRAVVVSVGDGNGLQIELQRVIGEPSISAIEVLEVFVPPECAVDLDCDDANPCTDDTCDTAVCVHAPNTDPCDDGAACTSGDVCSAGTCEGADTCVGGDVCNLGSGVCETPVTAVRINVNGPLHVGSDFPGTWAADPGAGVCGAPFSSTGNAINGTVDDALFSGESFGNPLTCEVDDFGSPLPPASYDVTLLFAEIYFGPGCGGGGAGTGSRIFNVSLEGNVVETGIDLFLEGGCAASTTDPTGHPVTRTYTVDVLDGVLDIEMPAVVNNGKLSAIQILHAGPPPECSVDLDCDDADLCTLDSCNAGSCEHLFDSGECVDTYPHFEGFDEGTGAFANVAGDDFDWTVQGGATPTPGTGPTADHTTGSGSYVYTEATGNTPALSAYFEGPCIDLAGMAQAELVFYAHMQGADMGQLDVEGAAGCGSVWSNLHTRSGDHGAGWQEVAVDLTSYVDQRVRVRFRGLTGATDTSDLAVDDVTLTASPFPPTSVPTDVQMPGTQPHEVGDLEAASDCSLCHQGYSPGDPLDEPSHGWGGSMMSHASRDPVFWAALAVAEQDFDGSGDFCLRCHLPTGWLAGRSEATDGSAMLESDADGVSCDFCHRLTDPDQTEHLGVQNPPFLAHDGGAPAEAFIGNGMYVLWDQASKLGPYADATPPHAAAESDFHRSEELCGTCHDVSNPVVGDLAPGNGATNPLPPGSFSGVLGGPVEDKAAFKNAPHAYGVVERTYSEHAIGLLSQLPISDYALLPAELQAGAIEAARDAAMLAGNGGNYADGDIRTFSCQSCHMRPDVGEGCSVSPPTRDDLPRHDLTGGNYWTPAAIEYLDGLGQLRLGGGLSAAQIAQMNAGGLRARQNLEDAASLSIDGDNLRVVNLTGHKLITGYPEGRRMWLNVKWFDAGNSLIAEEGEYGPLAVTIEGQPAQVETLLDPGNTVAYEIHKAISQEWAVELLAMGLPNTHPLSFDRVTGAVSFTLGDLAAQAPGTHHETFHFVLNDVVTKDTRIPPYGMPYDDALTRNTLPVPETLYGNPGPGGTYDYWDEVALSPPPGAHHAEVSLLYQPMSWEYIQFLELANDGSNAFLAQEGERILDAWRNTGMAAPHTMATATWTAPACADTLDNDGDGLIDLLDPGCDDADDASEGCGPSDDPSCDGIDDDCDGLFDEDAVCDDGLHCNGVETCVAGACDAGPEPDCDDGVACTDDACNESSDACDNLPNDSLCSDGLFCTGLESCNAQLGCQPGAPPTIDDAVACTWDFCDDDLDAVVHLAVSALCNDGDICDGAETCDEVQGCQPGLALDCDDGDPCTAESCDAITGCGHAPIAECGSGIPATGREGRWLLVLMLLTAALIVGFERVRVSR